LSFSILNSQFPLPKRYTPNDRWSRKARDEGYRARSVYKLEEIDVRWHLLTPGMAVLDLGAAPGSWLQYASENIGPKGIAIGIDLQAIGAIADNVVTLQQDMTDIAMVVQRVQEVLEKAKPQRRTLDLILSDAAPSTSGVHDVDQWRSIELNRSALAIGKMLLKPGGFCVLKVLRGGDYDEFLRDVKAEWTDVRTTKAAVSRDRSTEIYLLCKMKKAE
jgi:23S rRNA (uridine2552-2'-O)-methyltransferase